MDYKLYALTTCPFCQKVLNFLKKNEVEDKVEVRYIDKDKAYEEELVEGGGKKQVPCLHYGEEWLYESDDIIDYFKENLL